MSLCRVRDFREGRHGRRPGTAAEPFPAGPGGSGSRDRCPEGAAQGQVAGGAEEAPRQVRTVATRRPPASGTWLPPAAVSWCGSAPAPSVSFWRTVAGSTCGFRTGPPGNGSARSGSPTRRSGSPSRSLAGRTPKPQSPEFAKCVIVFTTFPASRFAPEAVLDWYRLRWQVELVFKRFKSVAQRGHLPKRGGEGSGGPAGRKADRPRKRPFPLGVRPPGSPKPPRAGGTSSGSCRTRSDQRQGRTCPCARC